MTKTILAGIMAALVGSPTLHAIDRYVSLTGGHVPPFTDWAGAATNIQDAIDVASAGETIWVTNGVYNTGGKVMYGGLTNRVALDKALTVQSVGGPGVTTIQGAWDPATNGPLAVRCAWLTNGAVLSGFTLKRGATRSSGNAADLASGGGVRGASTNDAQVVNCLIKECSAAAYGGGAYGASVRNCRILENSSWGSGGGVQNCFVRNSWVARCASIRDGSGAYGCTLVNSTLTYNTKLGSYVVSGIMLCTVVNSIVCFNDWANHLYCNLSYSCALPAGQGPGNIDLDPLFLGDALHLSPESPCRGGGQGPSVSGTDIDGQLWSNSPSMGCDEWCAHPLATIPPVPRAIGRVGEIWLTGAEGAGEPSSIVGWLKDLEPLEPGTKYSVVGTNLVIRSFDVPDAGTYRFVASNQFGFSTSSVFQVSVHCAAAGAVNATPPFANWDTAAGTIQDAIEASGEGEVVLVTNGVYNVGRFPDPGFIKLAKSTVTNRVVINKAVSVLSLNGAATTTIQGAWDLATTTGPLAVRCVHLSPNATLNGFTLLGGATLNQGSGAAQQGGGFYAKDSSCLVANCTITENAALEGGGAYGGSIMNCLVNGNQATYGGGIANVNARNSLIISNYASSIGGGFESGHLVNCTITANQCDYSGGGGSCHPPLAPEGTVRNCIVYGNTAFVAPDLAFYGLYSVYSSCSPAPLSDNGNINADPQLVDGNHIATTSPCRGAGDALYSTGTDFDGNPWANPPSMGCFEVWQDLLVGPLTVGLSSERAEVTALGMLPFCGEVVGKAARVEWDFGDGLIRTNAGWRTPYAWTNAGDYTVRFTAYNNDHPEGVSATLPVKVVPFVTPVITTPGWVTNQFSMSLPTQWGVHYLIEQATNLAPPVAWQTVTTLIGSDSIQEVIDPYATNTARFYRVRVP